MAAEKQEFPPLLSPGLHPKTVAELRQLCVERFPLSVSRGAIMGGVEAVVGQLIAVGLVGEIWINGSFLTEKIDPDDADMVFCVRADSYDDGTAAQRAALDWFSGNGPKILHRCHSFVTFDFPAEHILYESSLNWRQYWRTQFGISRVGQDKGIAVIHLCHGAL